MILQGLLIELGLSLGEAKIYLALLKNGTSSVNEIKDIVKLHRPNIYDYLEKLINRGLVNFVIEGKVKKFTAVNPEKLIQYLEEKESLIKKAMPEFKKIQKHSVEEIKVEVYKGKEGIKTLLNDIIKVGRNYMAFGVDESIWERQFPFLISNHFKREKEAKIKSRILTSNKTKIIYKNANYRYIDEKYFSPSSTIIYGDKVGIVIWEPLTIIIIKNKQNAKTQRGHFEILWKIAKLKPLKKVKIIK